MYEHNQEAKTDAGKPQLTLVPKEIIYRIAEVRRYGVMKYPDGGKDNWRRVEPQRYWDACVRHIIAALDDYKKTDEEIAKENIEAAQEQELNESLETQKDGGQD